MDRVEQLKGHDGSLRTKQEKSKSEKWIIRSRGSDGKLRHVDTLKFKPTIDVLSAYGPGEYSTQKVGRKFSKAERFVVTAPSHKNATSEKATLLQKPKSTVEPSVEEIWESFQMPEISPLSKETKRKAVPMKGSRRPVADSSSIVTKSSRPLLDKTVLSEKEEIPWKEITHPKKKGIRVTESTDSFVPRRARITPREPEKETKRETPTDDMKPNSYVKSPEEMGREDSYRPRPSESVSIEARPSSGLESLELQNHKELEPIKKRKSIYCARCGEHICDYDKIGLWKDDLTKCDYCHLYYCTECYPLHRCSKSEVCSWCKERFSNDFVIKAEYCRRDFCSRRCLQACFRKNRDTDDCQGCGDREDEDEEDKETVEEKEPEEEVYCPNCDAPMEEEDDTRVCLKCEGFFCSPYCFRRYHRSEGLRHKALTWEEYSDLTEEDERRTKVVIVRA